MFEESTPQPLPRLDLDDAPSRVLGELTVRRGAESSALPLVSIDLAASVCERIAEVMLVQVFANPFADHLEAEYTFPLSSGAAVSAFELEVAGRTIRGLVKERGAARADYRRAIEEGRRAALLEQERDNVFTIQVGNLPPGERATVRLTYTERLEVFEDGRAELRMPLVVAPRYVPGTPLDRQNSGSGVEDDTDGVPDASRVTPPRLASGSRETTAVSVEVTLRGNESAFAELASSQHATAVSISGSGLVVRLAKTNERANRDFVLRWRLAGDRVRSSLAVFRHAERGLFGMLTIVAPPAGERQVAPRDVVFLLDRSGSMQGVKMQSAARACAILLETLAPRDRYAIAAFDTTVEWMGGTPRFFAADEAGIVKGSAFLRAVDARGGTEIAPALAAAFGAVRTESVSAERVPVVVVITDGEVANESNVLKLVQSEIGRARLFAVGIDTAVNDALLRRMAAVGRGTASLVAPGDEVESALGAIAREIGAPEIVDLAIEDRDAGVLPGTQAPARFPDLFAGRCATVFLALESFGSVRLRGRRTDGLEYVEEVAAHEVDASAIAHLWARARVSDLEDRYRIETGSRADIKREIVDLSVALQFVTRFTAYLAVDDAEVVNAGGAVRHVAQPVEMPEDWELDGAAQMYCLSAPMMAGAAPPPPQALSYDARDKREQPLANRVQQPVRFGTPPAPSAVAPPAGRGRTEKRQAAKDGSLARRLVDALEAIVALLGEISRGTERLAELERARVEALDLARRLPPSTLAGRVVVFLERDAVDVVTRLRAGDAATRADFARQTGARLERDLLFELRRTSDGAAFWEGSI